MSSTAKKLINEPRESAFEISFPENSNDLDQHEEWFEYRDDGERRKLRIHDYADLFSREGLYEALVCEMLECNSPAELAALFGRVPANRDIPAEMLQQPGD